MPFPTTVKNDETSILRRIITKADILEHFKDYQDALSFYRAYPDLFVDQVLVPAGIVDDTDPIFEFYDYQRIMLRAMARYPNVYLVFSRGTAKSFVNTLWQIIKCILYPGTQSTVVANTKDQSSEILGAKFTLILNLIPALKFEILKKTQKDGDIEIIFKNGSVLRNVAVKGTTRGQRSTAITIEEIIECDGNKIDSVIRPLLAIARRAANGKEDPTERLRRQEVILTTAGNPGHYSYQRLVAMLIQMVTEPGEAIVIGGSYRVPVLGKLIDIDYIRNQSLSNEFNPANFDREFRSRWIGGSANSFFPSDTFDRLRSIQEPEFERKDNLEKGAEYIMSIDVGRFRDTSEVVIIKRVPQKGAPSTKFVVNIYTFEKMSFPEQAVKIKQLYYKYKPKTAVIDGAGAGAGLIDELVISQLDPETGQFLQPWQAINDDSGYYTKFKSSDGIKDLLYILKANQPFNTAMYSNLQTQLMTSKVRFLQQERLAKGRLETSRAKQFKEMSEDDKIEYMIPFYQTTYLKTQMLNLESHNEGINLLMIRTNNAIKKDKVSALGYGLYYIKIEMDDKELYRHSSVVSCLNNGLNTSTSGRQMPKVTFHGNRQYTAKGKY